MFGQFYGHVLLISTVLPALAWKFKDVFNFVSNSHLNVRDISWSAEHTMKETEVETSLSYICMTLVELVPINLSTF